VLSVEAPCTITLIAPAYLLNQRVSITSSSVRGVEAPPLIPVDLRTTWLERGCTVLLNGRPLGDVPIRRQIAQGNYTASVQCADSRRFETAPSGLRLRPELADDVQGGFYVWRLDEDLVER
jgi:hypothetical protein